MSYYTVTWFYLGLISESDAPEVMTHHSLFGADYSQSQVMVVDTITVETIKGNSQKYIKSGH